VCLNRIVRDSRWATYTSCRWTVHRCDTLSAAVAALQHEQIPIVLCERDLYPGTWREMLEQTTSLISPPFMIVTSRLADDYLWSEALNLGAYDVLAKPFDDEEVVRIVSLAWLHWQVRSEAPERVPKAWKDASGTCGIAVSSASDGEPLADGESLLDDLRGTSVAV
jgi:DNA-binding response OmpR family regulator